MTTLLNGREASDSLLKEVQQNLAELEQTGVRLRLVVVTVGEDPASKVYVGHKEKAAHKVGMDFDWIKLDESCSEEALLAKVDELNADPQVTGMIVQLPLPKHIDAARVIKQINPYKDVDGFHAYNVGKMLLSKDFEDLAPCTPKGIITLLDRNNIELEGKNAVVIGRSNIVGKPIAMMLLNRNATVTICHSRTQDLSQFTREADLIVVAVGKAHLLTADMVKEGVVIVDVGMNRLEDGRLVGDVDFDAVKDKASAITPVPGGVGPMTVATLLANTVTAHQKQVNL